MARCLVYLGSHHCLELVELPSVQVRNHQHPGIRSELVREFLVALSGLLIHKSCNDDYTCHVNGSSSVQSQHLEYCVVKSVQMNQLYQVQSQNFALYCMHTHLDLTEQYRADDYMWVKVCGDLWHETLLVTHLDHSSADLLCSDDDDVCRKTEKQF